MSRRGVCRSRRLTLASHYRAIARLALVAALAIGSAAPTVFADEKPAKTGTVQIEQIQLAFIGSGNLGGGTLQYGGKSYSFTIGGLGIGGFGASKIKAVGDVYNLTDISKFPGAYVQGRYGMVFGELSTGELLLKNPNGVYLRLRAQRTGVALALGGDAIYIKMD